ncbi:Tryptophan--tRNA ligase, mitochondrial [Kalmusia sp. IMI 367209]|nr:Tryptophan--tRNA ligase, mitochondrial [Kalmusia sp. IMI 367209]
MFSRQSAHALRRAASERCYINCALRRAESTDVHSSPASQPDNGPRIRREKTPNYPSSNRKVIFSGIQPTGIPHLGNYLGALRQWVKLQDEALPQDRLIFSIVDLHAITVAYDPEQLVQWRREMYAALLAVGLDPKRCVIFSQSEVLEHTQLMWILSCQASMGYLGRMTQWKSKLSLADNASPLDPSPSNKAALKLGLFSYPVLQAADILLYQATHVPVGEDQAQHLEFARELANGINHTFFANKKITPFIKPPQTIHSPAKRVMSLQNPIKKMSKSDPDPRSRILITDTRETIHAKIKHARTDSVAGISYDRDMRPGVSNLIDIMYYMDETKHTSPEMLAHDMFGADLSMKAMKEKVADTIDEALAEVRERFREQMARSNADVLKEVSTGAAKARSIAGDTHIRLKSAMGLRFGQRDFLKES